KLDVRRVAFWRKVSDRELGADLAASGAGVDPQGRPFANSDLQVAGGRLQADAAVGHRADRLVAGGGVDAHRGAHLTDEHVTGRAVDRKRPSRPPALPAL